jgi:hypothetical protein
MLESSQNAENLNFNIHCAKFRTIFRQISAANFFQFLSEHQLERYEPRHASCLLDQ